MKLILLCLVAATQSLKYFSAVIHSQEVASLPPLTSLWHPNLYIAKDASGSHYEIRHTAKPYDVSLSFLQTHQQAGSPSDQMDCRCRFESQGLAPGAGSFLEKPKGEVKPITQIETPGKSKALTYEIPLTPRVDVDPQPQIHLQEHEKEEGNTKQTQATQPYVQAPQQLFQPAPPSQMFQQLPLGLTVPEAQTQQMVMYVPMMVPQTYQPQGYYQAPTQGYYQPYPQPAAGNYQYLAPSFLPR